MLLVKLSKACKIRLQQFIPLMRLVSIKTGHKPRGYQRIMDRTKVFIPQGSIIGYDVGNPLTTKSSCKVLPLGGIAQHDTFSWQIEDKHFVQLDKTNSDSQQVDTTIKGGWPQSLTKNPALLRPLLWHHY